MTTPTAAPPTAAKMTAHPGAMLALYPSAEVALRVNELATAMTAANPTFTPAHAADLHITLVHLAEDASEIEDKRTALQELLGSEMFDPLTGVLNGIGRFTEPASGPVYLNVDSPQLPEFRQRLVDLVKSAGIEPAANHGFAPHLTIGYAPADDLAALPVPDVIPVEFSRIALVWGGQRTEFEAAPPPAEDVAQASDDDDDVLTVQMTAPDGKTVKALTSDLLVSYGGAIKTMGSTERSANGHDVVRVGGYVIHWGSESDKDLDGEYFAPDTELYLDYWDKRPALYHHGIDLSVKGMKIGVIDRLVPDDVGLWAEAQIDLYNDYVRAIHKMVERGLLKWSSGAMPQLVTTASNGKILTWPIVEGSLTPTPAKPFGTLVVPVKALKALPLPDLTKELQAEESTDGEAAGQPIVTATSSSTSELAAQAASTEPKQGEPMTPETLLAIVTAMADKLGIQLDEQQQQAALDAAIEAYSQLADAAPIVTEEEAAKMTEEEQEELQKEEEQEAMKAARDPQFLQQLVAIVREAIPSRRRVDLDASIKSAVGSAFAAIPKGQPKTGAFRANARIEVSTKYARLSAEDMSFVARFMKAIKARDNEQWTPPTEFLRELADKTDREMAKGHLFEAETMRGVKAIKANEVNHSTLASYGDEWVPTLWLDRIWAQTRIENVVAPQFAEVDMPSNPYELPIESSDPTVYRAPETTGEAQLTLAASDNPIPDSRVGTGKVTLTADKLALRVLFSAEVDEDSIIPFAGQLRGQAQRAILDAIDNVDLNADNTASGNINYDAGTPGATDKFNVAFKGLIYTALIANSGNNKVDMGGVAPTLAFIRAARWKMASRYASRVQDLVSFCDAATYAKLLSLPEFLTMDKIGAQATIVTGQVGSIDGIPVLLTNEMALAASNGKVHSSTGNTFGRLVFAHKPSFYAGYRRRVAVDLERVSYYDAWVLTATVRPAFVARDAFCASILYDIAV